MVLLDRGFEIRLAEYTESIPKFILPDSWLTDAVIDNEICMLR